MDCGSVTKPAEVTDVRLVLFGFGNVAQRFCRIAADRAQELADVHGLRLLVTAASTAKHGAISDPVGLTPGELLELFEKAGNEFPDPALPARALIAEAEAHVAVESTPLELGGATAIDHVEAAFSAGMDVITVNKGPIAWAYRRLKQLADDNGRQFRFEGVVMDGCPVFNLVEFALPGDRVMGFRGVLNSTTNYVLEAITEGATFDEAVVEAQHAGFAESDPTFDIDGHDAAAKVAALANVFFDAGITPEAVERDTIRSITADDVSRVISYGRRLRVVCSASRANGVIEAGVALETVRNDDPLYWVTGTTSALILQTELAGTVEILEREPDLMQTAYAIYADLLTIYRRR